MSNDPERKVIRVTSTDRSPVRIYSEPTTGNPEMDRQLISHGIRLGIPVENHTEVSRGRPSYMTINTHPNIFLADTFVLQDQGEDMFSIPNVMLMMGHGIAADKDSNTWRFLGTGKKVTDTMMAYEHVAAEIGWAPIDALLVCRQSTATESTGKVIQTFTQGNIPHIYADSTVTISRSIAQNNRTSGLFQPNEGAPLIVANAKSWNNRSIGRWINFWQERFKGNDTRSIPYWAIQPNFPYYDL